MSSCFFEGDGDNWWVCVFNKDAQFPAVIDNIDVEWKVSFLGADIDGRGSKSELLRDAFLQNAPSIPPDPQKLWEAFCGEMSNFPEERRKAYGLDLGDPDTNEFTIHFSDETNHPM